jgi:hypothetical protein
VSANSGSEGALSGFDSLPPDYKHSEGDQWMYPWDSDRPLPRPGGESQ